MGFPIVLINDDGIRPAGRADECFYCHRKVGQEHAHNCVCIVKTVLMGVTANLGNRTVQGTWTTIVPHDWDKRMIEFHRNEGTWCGGNFLNEEDRGTVTWSHNDQQEVWSDLKRLEAGGSCLCGELRFEYIRTTDDTPQRRND